MGKENIYRKGNIFAAVLTSPGRNVIGNECPPSTTMKAQNTFTVKFDSVSQNASKEMQTAALNTTKIATIEAATNNIRLNKSRLKTK